MDPTESDDHAPGVEPRPITTPARPTRPVRVIRSRIRLAVFLFVATCLSTFFSGGAFLTRGDDIRTFVSQGLLYAVPVMLILLFHELGHYFQARRYRVPATLPYFIPMPITPFGTMGAVIIQGSGSADRKAMFDIAISGPLAGLIVALPVAWIGISQSQTMPIPEGYGGWIFADPLIMKWMISIVHGPVPEKVEVLINPMLFAGWVGIFITALNLIPIGQLDGGHILYTLIGRRSHIVAIVLLVSAVVFMLLSGYPSYLLMVLLLFLMGPRHPPTADDNVPLGLPRIILGWLTLSFILIGFTLIPIRREDPRRPNGNSSAPVRVKNPALVREDTQPSQSETQSRSPAGTKRHRLCRLSSAAQPAVRLQDFRQREWRR